MAIHCGRYGHGYTEAVPDFVVLVWAFGWQARTVERREELNAALAECLASDGPFFLEILVASEENRFHMIQTECGNHEFLLGMDPPYRRPASEPTPTVTSNSGS